MVEQTDSGKTMKKEPVENEGAANTGFEEVPPFVASETGKLRYAIEHQILREHFFSEPKKTAALVASENWIFLLYENVFKSQGIEMPYTPEDFSVKTAKISEQTCYACIELPEPEFVPLCYRIYILFDMDFRMLSYYTIERGRKRGFLCEWDKNGNHINYHGVNTPMFDRKQRAFQSAAETLIISEYHAKKYGLSL